MLRKCYLNDLRILDTETFVWSRLRVSGTPPNPRYGHSASISGPDIVFFGGWTHESGKRVDKRESGNTEYFTILNLIHKFFLEIKCLSLAFGSFFIRTTHYC